MSATTLVEFDTNIQPEEMVITQAAGVQLAKLYSEVDDDEVKAVRVYVAGGGCSGMTYGMTYADNLSQFDKVLSGEGYVLYVDTVAINYLKGAEIDFVERETGSTFVFNNVFQATGGSGTCSACGAAGGEGS